MKTYVCEKCDIECDMYCPSREAPKCCDCGETMIREEA